MFGTVDSVSRLTSSGVVALLLFLIIGALEAQALDEVAKSKWILELGTQSGREGVRCEPFLQFVVPLLWSLNTIGKQFTELLVIRQHRFPH